MIAQDTLRGTGRTAKLTYEISQAVRSGVTDILVVGVTTRQATGIIKPMLVTELQTWIEPVIEFTDRIEVDNAILKFCGITEAPWKLRGVNSRVFIDHSAIEAVLSNHMGCSAKSVECGGAHINFLN